MSGSLQIKLGRYVAAGMLALAAFVAGGQTVYKCQSKETVVYSHEPCLGSQVVDTTPTQGLDKSSGKSRKGADVQKIELNKAMADALQPIFGETAEQRDRRHRRFKLATADKLECSDLDTRLLAQETAMRRTDKGDIVKAQAALFESRKRYRELRC